MNENDFFRQQQAAVERMREFNSRSIYKGNAGQPMPPVPPFVKVQGETGQRSKNNNTHHTQNRQSNKNYEKEERESFNAHSKEDQTQKNDGGNTQKNNNSNSFFDGLNLPFLDMFKKDGDMTLIIGLLLILLSEKADKKLLFALIYILL